MIAFQARYEQDSRTSGEKSYSYFGVGVNLYTCKLGLDFIKESATNVDRIGFVISSLQNTKVVYGFIDNK